VRWGIEIYHVLQELPFASGRRKRPPDKSFYCLGGPFDRWSVTPDRLISFKRSRVHFGGYRYDEHARTGLRKPVDCIKHDSAGAIPSLA
jgi:hypothetical protein